MTRPLNREELMNLIAGTDATDEEYAHAVDTVNHWHSRRNRVEKQRDAAIAALRACTCTCSEHRGFTCSRCVFLNQSAAQVIK